MAFFMHRRKGVPCLRTLGLALPLWLAGCSSVSESTPANSTSAPAAIRAVLDQQQQDWNDGNIDRFMLGYAKGETTRFASGDRILLGWQQVLERYRTAYGDRAAMGTLAFSEIDIVMMGHDHALAFGRWQLKRDMGDLHGLFSLVFHKSNQNWHIVHDHTSKGDAPL